MNREIWDYFINNENKKAYTVILNEKDPVMTDSELKEIIITQNEDFKKSDPEYIIREGADKVLLIKFSVSISDPAYGKGN